ncbi:WecA-like glycosyltransferase [Planctomycetes bacterium MalM25]|nr:WecA-like glycosyltransferase [Planctomycetes bacterium MalM25]
MEAAVTLSSLFFSEYRAATYVLALAVGWLVAYLLTPVVRRSAIKLGFVDKPGGRKTQKQAISLGGGVAVFGGAIVSVAVAFLFADAALTVSFFEGDGRFLVGLALASTATLVLGLFDDATNMRGRYKLLGQLVIAGVLVYLGLRVETLGLFGGDLSLGWMAIPFSVFWLVGSTNAINLLDGIDGLASSIGMVLCLTLAAINAYFGQFPEAVVMLAVAGALLGFLRYNFAPASIYLGDAGSMVIGLVIGAVALHTQQKAPLAVALIIPLAVWAVPILDSGAAIVRRRLTGRSIFDPDRGHLHHSLLTRGWSVRQASIFITLICAITCLSAALGVFWRNEWVVLGTVAFVVVFLIGSKTFGHVEFELLRNRMRQHGLSIKVARKPAGTPHHGTVRLQGSHEWEVLWDSLVESADDYGLTKLQLTIHMPAVHEAFYANWRAPKAAVKPHADSVWRVAHPLMVDGESVGKLEVSGVADDPARSTPTQVTQVLDFLEPIEENIRRVKEALTAGERPAAVPAAKPTPDGLTPNPSPGNGAPGVGAADLLAAGQ